MNWAYVSGLIDGEAWIGISKQSYAPRFSIEMTHKPTIDKLKIFLKYPLQIYSSKHKRPNPQHKIGYKLTITHRQTLLRLLNHILPYCITKHQQVKYLKEYIERNGYNHNDKHYTKYVPKHVLEQRIFYYNLLKSLNKKGINQ